MGWGNTLSSCAFRLPLISADFSSKHSKKKYCGCQRKSSQLPLDGAKDSIQSPCQIGLSRIQVFFIKSIKKDWREFGTMLQKKLGACPIYPELCYILFYGILQKARIKNFLLLLLVEIFIVIFHFKWQNFLMIWECFQTSMAITLRAYFPHHFIGFFDNFLTKKSIKHPFTKHCQQTQNESRCQQK